MALVIRVPNTSFPDDGRLKVVPTFVNDQFNSLSSAWTIRATGANGTPSVSGGTLQLESSSGVLERPLIDRVLTGLPAKWSASVTIAASATNLNGADNGQAGLFVGTTTGTGYAWAINRTSLPTASYMTWGTVTNGSFTQTGPNGLARSQDVSKAPGPGQKIGIVCDGTKFSLQVNGGEQGTFTPPAGYLQGGTLFFGLIGQYGAKVSFDNLVISA